MNDDPRVKFSQISLSSVLPADETLADPDLTRDWSAGPKKADAEQ